MGTKCPSAASPGDPLGTFPSLGKYLAAGAAKPSPHLQKEKGKRRGEEKREKSPSQILRRPVLEGLG